MSAEAVAYVYRHADSKGPTFAVHLAIADAVNDLHDWRFWAPAGELAKKARVDRNTVGDAIRRLCDAGWLEEVEPPNGRAGVYRFLFPDGRRVVYETRGRRPAGKPAPRPAGIPAAPAGIPAPLPYIKTQETQPSGGCADGTPAINTLVALFVDESRRVGVTPTARVRGQLARQLRRLVDVEHKGEDVLRLAVKACAREAKAPTTLDYIVADAERHLASRTPKERDRGPVR